MNGERVARRYAQALFELGREQGLPKLESYGQTLQGLRRIFDDAPELVRLFRAPVISSQEKRQVISTCLDQLHADQEMRHFCFLLADKERLPFLGAIAECFGKLLDVAQGIVRGSLQTAVALDDTKQAGIRSVLERQTSKTIALQFEVNPAILGGIVLQVGDRVFDASLRAQLSSLRDIIKRGE